MKLYATLTRFWVWLLLPILYFALSLWAHHYFFEVPVLMYHHVGAAEDHSSVNVTPESFERQMEFLKVHRYRVIPLAQLIKEIKSNQKIPAKTVSITFDDGYIDNIQNAFPVLKRLNFPATIFMITSNVNQHGFLTDEDLRIMHESDVAIGSHTTRHAFLPELSMDEAKKELSESKKALEKILNQPTTLLSYPAGGVTPQIRLLAEAVGYEGAVTTNYGQRVHDPFALHRIKISESSGNLFNFWIKLSGYYHLGKKRVEARPYY